jgi:LacI family transcriptional regulator
MVSMDTKKVTMREVAKLAKVSKTTVSHVLNKTRPVSEELQNRVFQAVRELNYQPNVLARSLRRKETCTIGLVIPRNDNPYYAEVARGVEELSFNAGYSVILCNSDRNIEKEIQYADLLYKKRVDGILFVGAWAGDQTSHLHLLQAEGVPLVVVDRYVPDLEIDSIVTDNTLGGWLATSHLYELGHRRIGCIGGTPEHTPNADRIKGYRKALTEFSMPIDEDLIVRYDFQFESGYLAAQYMLNLKNRPTALFACNDLMAIGVMRAAFDMGYRIPQDLSIVGFDDIQMAAYVNPPLTTIAQPKYEMGRYSVEMLLERIHESKLPTQEKILEPKLIIRGTTSPPSLS